MVDEAELTRLRGGYPRPVVTGRLRRSGFKHCAVNVPSLHECSSPSVVWSVERMWVVLVLEPTQKSNRQG